MGLIRAMLVVSLTSIPPRFGNLRQLVGSLKAQSRPPDRIIVTIPEHYRRFPGHWRPPDIAGVTVFRPETDYGPAGKALGAMQVMDGQACQILYCDDDWCFGPDWIAGFLATAAARPPNEVIAASGFDIDRLGLISTHPPQKPGQSTSRYVDIAQGFGGVLVQSRWLNAIATPPPDIAWPVDDIWLSAHFAKVGLKIWMAGHLRQGAQPLPDPNSLQASTIDGQNRAAANRAAAEYLSKRYDIWR